MFGQAKNDKQIEDYLLGQLDEAEQCQVELKFLKNAEFLDTLRAAEDDLIDDYIGNELDDEERKRFEQVLSNAPHRVEKIRFAREFMRNLAEQLPTTATSDTRHAFWGIFNSLRNRNFQLRLANALAIALLLAGGLWFYIALRQTRSELAQLQQQKSFAEEQQKLFKQQAENDRARKKELEGELASEREQRIQQEEISGQNQGGSGSTGEQLTGSRSASTIASFVLSPGLTRGSDEPERLALPRGAQVMRLQLDLEAGDDYKTLRAELRTTGGNVVWSEGALQVIQAAGGRSVRLSLPTGLLQSGEYELTLRAATSPRTFEDIGYYYFSVLKK